MNHLGAAGMHCEYFYDFVSIFLFGYVLTLVGTEIQLHRVGIRIWKSLGAKNGVS